MKLIEERIRATIPPEVEGIMHASFTGAEVPFPLQPIDNGDNNDEEGDTGEGDAGEGDTGDDGLILECDIGVAV